MKRRVNKLTALLLSIMTVALMIGGELCEIVNVDKAYAETSDEADELTEAANSLLGSAKDTSSKEEGKEETVYVIAEPDGTPRETIVSAWLKNPEGKDVLKDDTDLENIENVKGEETFTKDKDGNIIWNADGKDIYYQGNTNKVSLVPCRRSAGEDQTDPERKMPFPMPDTEQGRKRAIRQTANSGRAKRRQDKRPIPGEDRAGLRSPGSQSCRYPGKPGR